MLHQRIRQFSNMSFRISCKIVLISVWIFYCMTLLLQRAWDVCCYTKLHVQNEMLGKQAMKAVMTMCKCKANIHNLSEFVTSCRWFNARIHSDPSKSLQRIEKFSLKAYISKRQNCSTVVFKN